MTTDEGLAARASGVDNNLATAEGSEYLRRAEEAIEQLIEMDRPFSADHVRSMIPAAIVPHSKNVLPSLFSRLSKSGRIRPIGEARSTRKTRHGSTHRMWVPADSQYASESEALRSQVARLTNLLANAHEERDLLIDVVVAIKKIVDEAHAFDPAVAALVQQIKEQIPS